MTIRWALKRLARRLFVEDGQLLTARWPKGAELFADTFIRKLQ
ncbi:hypothetical protein [Paenibacillus monticola]|nr:hypothetical protein [Paenibacillus monticola]